MFLKLSLSPLEYGTTVKNVVVFICVPVAADVVVPLLLTGLKVHLCLQLLENPVRVIAPAECCMDVLGFLF